MRLKDELGPVLGELLAADSAQLAFEMEVPAEYGNEELVFRGDRFQFKVIKDRGQIFVDVAPCFENRDWYMLPRLFEYLGVGREEDFSPENYGPTTKELLEKQVNAFADNAPRIAALFSRENYPTSREELQAFWRKKVRELFGNSAFSPRSGKT